jgi:hypothetical protein
VLLSSENIFMIKGDDMGSGEVLAMQQMDVAKLFMKGHARVESLLNMTEPLPNHLEEHVVDVEDPTLIRGCVDEREKGLLVVQAEDGGIWVKLSEIGEFNLRAMLVQENESEDRETPFPGGRAGVYYYSAMNSLLSGEAMEQDFWEAQTGDEFAVSFVDYFTQVADSRIAEFEDTHNMVLDLPVHIDDHSVEDAKLFNDDGEVDVEGLKKMLEEGLGCGFAKVFMNVLIEDLKHRGKAELAQKLTEKLGGDLSGVGGVVSRRLIHRAIASGSSIEVLEHGHEFDAITYMTNVGETFDRTASRKKAGFKSFVVNIGWVEAEDHPIHMLIRHVAAKMNNQSRETSAVAMNSITFVLLGAGQAPRYSK